MGPRVLTQVTEPAAHSDPGLGGASAPADRRSLGPGPFPLSLVVAPPGLEASAPLFVIPAGPDLPRLLVSSCSATTFSPENTLRGTCAEKVLRDAAATACCPGPAAAGLPLRPEPLSVDKSGSFLAAAPRWERCPVARGGQAGRVQLRGVPAPLGLRRTCVARCAEQLGPAAAAAGSRSHAPAPTAHVTEAAGRSSPGGSAVVSVRRSVETGRRFREQRGKEKVTRALLVNPQRASRFWLST